ncbi:MAG: methyltransferase domain-containing protein [Candidatus Aenigmarchaeota archaeon]|nr:methyltransferase domain-containing protein [Candidatus Aenigmarchaeota archaeon]
MRNEQAEKIKNHFNSKEIDYDVCANYVVPRNEELHNVIVNTIRHDRNSKIKILDLGVGTGLGAWKILSEFPYAHLTGIDFSSKMLKRCKERLSIFKNRILLVEANFNKIDFPEKYDVIISAVTIHNSKIEQQKDLILKAYKNLNNNGIFVNGDFIKSNSEHINQKLRNFYENYLREKLKGKELKTWLRHAFEEDKPVEIKTHLNWLKMAKFKKIECVWMYMNLAVYYGIK